MIGTEIVSTHAFESLKNSWNTSNKFPFRPASDEPGMIGTEIVSTHAFESLKNSWNTSNKFPFRPASDEPGRVVRAWSSKWSRSSLRAVIYELLHQAWRRRLGSVSRRSTFP